MTLLLSIWLHDRKYQSNGVYHSDITLPLRHQRLQQASQITMFMAVVRKKTALSPGLVGQSLQSSFWYQSEDTGISGSSWGKGKLQGSRKEHCIQCDTAEKKYVFPLEDAKHTTVKEEKQLNDMTFVSEGRKNGPLLCNRFLCHYFKYVKETEYIAIKQKDDAEQKNHVWRSISNTLQETWTHFFTGKTPSPGLKSLYIKASSWIQIWKY